MEKTSVRMKYVPTKLRCTVHVRLSFQIEICFTQVKPSDNCVKEVLSDFVKKNLRDSLYEDERYRTASGRCA